MEKPIRITKKFLADALDSTDKAYFKADFMSRLVASYHEQNVSFSSGFAGELTRRVIRFSAPTSDHAQRYQAQSVGLLHGIVAKEPLLRRESFAIVRDEITGQGPHTHAALALVPFLVQAKDAPMDRSFIRDMVQYACPAMALSGADSARAGLVQMAKVNKANAFSVLSSVREWTNAILDDVNGDPANKLTTTLKTWAALARPARDFLAKDDAINLYHIARDCNQDQTTSRHAFDALTAVCAVRPNLYPLVQGAVQADVQRGGDKLRQKSAKKLGEKIDRVMDNLTRSTPPAFRTKPNNPDAKICAMSNYLLSLQR